VEKEQHLVHCIMYVAFYPSWHAPVNLRKRGFLNNVNSRKKVRRKNSTLPWSIQDIIQC